jgi:23S rRNA (cytidine2498-2'-O)-methyltransferase
VKAVPLQCSTRRSGTRCIAACTTITRRAGRTFAMHTPPESLMSLCRAGFEPECVQELAAMPWGGKGHAAAERGTGFVLWRRHDHAGAGSKRPGADTAVALRSAAAALPAWRDLTFVREALVVVAHLRGLDPRDRIGPIGDALQAAGMVVDDVRAGTPDSESGAALKGLARSIEAAAVAVLRKRGLLARDAGLRLHLVFLGGTDVVLGLADPARCPPWPLGIPRLKFPRAAPSRSTLKLDEAFLVLLDDAERRRLLRPGMTAVDLGAAPGGWTYQLVARGMQVTAVDNGPMDDALMASGQVEHRREDGFRFRPRRSVDWLVCDMVEQPARVATLMRDWLAEGASRAAIFNLKLPMKKRWLETQRCIGLLRESLGGRWTIRAKQLYHDREEVTVAALPLA